MKKFLLVVLSGLAGLVTALMVITAIMDDDDKEGFNIGDTYW